MKTNNIQPIGALIFVGLCMHTLLIYHVTSGIFDYQFLLSLLLFQVFIQKRSGCSHMTCRNCNTSFCYRCGHRYIQMKLIGKHSDRFSPFGCKYNLLPDKPVARKAVRGSVLGKLVLSNLPNWPLVLLCGNQHHRGYRVMVF